MPRPAPTSPAGGGQNTNVYAGGVFDLDADDALPDRGERCRSNPPRRVPPEQSVGESLDYANHQSSLNAFQSEPDDDGVVRYVVAHTDPGAPGWLDTAGLRRGFLSLRWTYSQEPDRLPETSVRTVPLAELRSHRLRAPASSTPRSGRRGSRCGRRACSAGIGSTDRKLLRGKEFSGVHVNGSRHTDAFTSVVTPTSDRSPLCPKAAITRCTIPRRSSA